MTNTERELRLKIALELIKSVNQPISQKLPAIRKKRKYTRKKKF